MAKMWAGRTDGKTDKIADDFNPCIHFDSRMYRQNITGSMVHAAMLAKQGIITQTDADTLIDGLDGILTDLDTGALAFDMTCEDIHMFVEQVLTQRLGDVGKKLHTARSRNDQVALDIRMYLRNEIDEITALTKALVAAITANADAEAALVAGKVDAWVIDDLTAAEMVKIYNEENGEVLVILDEAMTTEPYAFAFAFGSEDLVAKINEILSGLVADGTVAAIFEKYEAPYTAPAAE